MDKDSISGLFDLHGKVAVVTGGAGVLCAGLCRDLAARGAREIGRAHV